LPARNRARYGYHHRELRKSYLAFVRSGKAICWRCGKRIDPNGEWDLGHDDDTGRYGGPEHRKCNRGEPLRAVGEGSREEELSIRTSGPHAWAVWREWWRQARREAGRDVGPETWSRHWGDDNEYDGRCPHCRERGEACRGKKSNPEGWPIGIG
jgi:hypothetical protein